MIAWLILWLFVLTFWPLVVQSFVVIAFTISLIIHIPRIYASQSGSARMWAALVVVFLVEVAATWLVVQHPSADIGRALAIAPTTTIALFAGGWVLFVWVLLTEIPARIERQRQERLLETGESLDAVLQPF